MSDEFDKETLAWSNDNWRERALRLERELAEARATNANNLGLLEVIERQGVEAAAMQQRYNEVVEQRDEARYKLNKLREAYPRDGDWWCPSCRDALPPERVTFEERCDTCGTPVTTSGAGLDADLTAMHEVIDDRVARVGELERDLAALRERHAEVVKMAFRDGYADGRWAPEVELHEAWLASKAKKGLEAER